MKLSECKHGLIVRNKHSFLIGMIVGVSSNAQFEALSVVQYQNGETYDTHPANLELYED